MAALGLEHDRQRAALGQMRQRRVPQLVEGPASGVPAERRRCGAVAEACLAGREIGVADGWVGAGAFDGEEQRPAAPSGEVAA